MHEESPERPQEPVESEPAGPVSTEPVSTDNPEVDEVIRAVQELEERPVEEHVGVFEQAHEQLRRALDAS